MIDLIGVGNGDTLSSIDLSIEDGVPTVLLGPTGAGKTALLRIMAGLDPPHHGQVSSEPPWGTIAAAAVLSLLPGLVIVWAARHHIATVLSFGRR
jgi:ABC-type cobalamin/Fe3+-siderophores transport system ATPase subunit